MATDIRQTLVKRRLERMRLGQAAFTPVELVSDPEIRFALVPLTGAERLNATEMAAEISVGENVAGIMVRDHVQKVEILAASIRDPQNLDQRLYRDGKELQDELQDVDIDHVYDAYLEMTENSNPTMDSIPPEEFDELKKALQQIDMSALSGRSWYALKRFLSALIQDGLLTGNLYGFTSSMKLTTTSDSDESTLDAYQNSTEQNAKSAERL